MKRQLPNQILEEQFLSPDTRNAPLSKTIRLGAQLMLQVRNTIEAFESVRLEFDVHSIGGCVGELARGQDHAGDQS